MKISSALIPECFLSSPEYIELNEASKHNIEEKINYCLEVIGNLDNWLATRNDPLENILDNLELDCLSIVSSGFGATDNHVSIYQFHSSWTDECSKGKLNALVNSEIKSFLKKNIPIFDASTDKIILWLNDWSKALSFSIESFMKAGDFDLAISTMITIDSLLFIMLFVTSVARLNPNM